MQERTIRAKCAGLHQNAAGAPPDGQNPVFGALSMSSQHSQQFCSVAKNLSCHHGCCSIFLACKLFRSAFTSHKICNQLQWSSFKEQRVAMGKLGGPIQFLQSYLLSVIDKGEQKTLQ